MPRRLDPKKGLPGLFAPGRPKAAEMSFLVEATPPRPRKRAAKPAPAPVPVPAAVPVPVPAPVPVPVPVPVPDYIALAPAFRAVPTPPPEPAPLRLAEVPALVGCALGWIVSALRTGR